MRTRLVALAFSALLAVVLVTQVQLPAPHAVTWVPIDPKLQVNYLPGAHTALRTSGHAAILLENTTGTVLYAHNEHATRAPASLTKIMTALLALETGRLDDIVTVSRRAASVGGSSAHLYAGQKIRMEDLLHAMLLRSGNDAAIAVGEHIAGSLPAFVAMMNERARELGATRTHFANPHGLDRPNHFSTAFDLAMLSRVALLYPRFAAMVNTRFYNYADQNITWKNTNRLLWSYEGAEGIKTGTTGQAGNCLAAAASRNGMQLISVVLGSANRWNDTTKMLTYGFDHFRIETVAEKGVPLAQVNLPGSRQPLVVVPAADIRVIVPTAQTGEISTQVSLLPLRLPIYRGSRLGTYQVLSAGTELASIPLIAGAAVHKRTLLWLLTRWLLGLVGL